MKKLFFKVGISNFFFALLFVIDRYIKFKDTQPLLSRQEGLGVFKLGPIDFFFEYFHNSNIAFSIPIPIIISIVVTIIILLLLTYRWFIAVKKQHVLVAVGLCSIFWGALSNLYDRINLGYVVDYLNFAVAKLSWPVFNIADALIVFGVILIVISIFKKKNEADSDSFI